MRFFVNVFFLIFFTSSFFASGEEKELIVLGTSSALSGPAAQLGLKLNSGASLYFDKINRTGGVFGRQIKLVSVDDGYEPFRTVGNTLELIKEHQVFALFNYVGTPTSFAVLSIINEFNLPYLTPFTGAEFLRSPINKNIFNLRASYYQEAFSQIDYLVDIVGAKKIGLLVQADEFGKAVESGYLQAMEKRNISPVVTTRFRRNTEDITLALGVLKKHQVDAVAFVGTYKPLAELINTGYTKNFTPFFSTVSFISSYDLFSRIKYPSRVLVTEVMPQPNTCQLPICAEFIQDSKKAKLTELDPVIFEGYVNAKLFVEVAKKCQDQLTRACLIAQFEVFNGNMGGLNVSFNRTDHQGLNDVYFSLFDTTEAQ